MLLIFNYLITKGFSCGWLIFFACLTINNLAANPNNNYTEQDYELAAQCQYYKTNANDFCLKTYSSEYEKRQECQNIHKQRWCHCMGKDKNCYLEHDFYW